ncbi:hypothetical protein GCM10023213_44940 [Prosthecobacter algae]|uniref:Uncharacterized protein n=1 Tax=Prosthecobacter algae TaxID=1144682 RepID=A0ABP9PLA4_9BACT
MARSCDLADPDTAKGQKKMIGNGCCGPLIAQEVRRGQLQGELLLGKSLMIDVFELIKTIIKGTQNRTDLHFMAFKTTFVRVHRSDDSNPYLFN